MIALTKLVSMTIILFMSSAKSIRPYPLADTLGCLPSKKPGGYEVMTDRERSRSSSAVDKNEAKSIEEKPLLSDIGTDVDRDLSATVNHDEERSKANFEDCEAEKPSAKSDTTDNQINDKDEKSVPKTEDPKGTIRDSKKDEAPNGNQEEEKKSESTTTNSTAPTQNIPDDLASKSGRDWDGEELKRGYVPTPRPKLLGTRAPHYEPPPGAKFYKAVSWHSILEIEYEDPFEKIKLFNLIGVEKRPVTLKDVPAEYRPYEGCIFVSTYYCKIVYFDRDSLCRLVIRRPFTASLYLVGDPLPNNWCWYSTCLHV
jgi:hypothetical protein